MNKIIKTVSSHKAVIISALFIVFLINLPMITSFHNYGTKNFKGIYPMFSDDEDYYWAKVREVYDGHQTLSNIYYQEHKDGPFMNSILVEWLMGNISKSFGVPIPYLFIMSDVIFPFAMVVLLYVLLFGITKSKSISFLFSLFYCFIEIPKLARPINLQLCLPMFVLGLYFVWKYFSLDSDKYKKAYLLNSMVGIVFGLLLFMYPYLWTSLFAIYLLVIAYQLFIAKEYLQTIKSFLFFLISALPFSIIYLINSLKASASPYYSETILRMGAIFTHWPGAFSNVGLLSITLATLLIIRKHVESKKIFSFVAISLLALIILNWQNVITGQYILFSTHYVQTVFLIIVIGIAVIVRSGLSELIKKRVNLKILLALIISFSLLSYLFYVQHEYVRQVISYGESKDEMANLQNMAPIFEWLEKETLTDSTIVLYDDYDRFYPIYTHNNLFQKSYAGVFLMSDLEVESRWAIQNIFENKITPDFVKEYHMGIWVQEKIEGYQLYQNRRRIIKKLTGITIPPAVQFDDQEINEVIKIYQKKKNSGYSKAFKTYKADYLIFSEIYDKNLNISEKIKADKGFEYITTINGRKIYKIN
jgi:hypothetical protein